MATEARDWVSKPDDRHGLSNDSESEALSFGLLLSILRSGRRRILFCGFGALLCALALALAIKPNFTATGSFVPPGSGMNNSASALMGQLAAFNGGGAGALLGGGKNQGDLYVAILKSETVARDMVARFDLKTTYRVKKESQAEKILAASSLFEVGSKDPVVTIHVTDKNPVRARDLVKGYLDELQKTSGSLALTESSQRRAFYEQRLAREKDELANAEVALKQSQERTGLVAPAGQTASNIQALAQVNAQITDLQARLSALRQEDAEENPDVIRIREQIASLQSQATQMEKGQSRSDFGRFSTAQVPGLELEYIRKARDVKYHETLFDIIAKQYEAARLDEAKDAPLQILDEPTVPDTKSGPSRSIICIVGLILGLLFGVVWTLLRYARETRSSHASAAVPDAETRYAASVR